MRLPLVVNPIFAKLRALLRRKSFEAEMAEEMRQHLERRTQEKIADGLSPDEARYAAQREFGGIAQVQEQCRDERRFIWLEQFAQDFRYAARQLRRNPGFTTVVVLTLALGIGANTAIFSIVRGVLLKPLVYGAPERLVTLLHHGQHPVAPADFLDWHAQSRSFEAMGAAEFWGGTLSGSDQPEAIPGIRFSEEMFDVLGVKPLLGRTFRADDFKPGQQRVLVLGHALWQRRFGGESGIIGQSIMLNGEPCLVAGVMPPEFRFAPFWAARAELAAPLDLAPRATSRGGNSLRIFARLKPGVTREQAQAEMTGICRQLERAYPATNTGRTVQVDSLLDKTVGNVRGSLHVLAGAVGLVLLIACVNVANLLLARASTRQKEMAVRAALGASRGRTIRQLLTESILLALTGGALGLWLGVAGVEAIKQVLAGDAASLRLRMPRVEEITVDGSVLLYTLAATLLTGLVFGLLPALQAARQAQQDVLQDAGRGSTGGRKGLRLRSWLVVTEIALALIALTGAGLLLRSFERLSAIDPGFDPHQRLSFVVSLQGGREAIGPKRETFYRELLEKIEGLPGVVSASAVNHLPLAGDLWTGGLSVEGWPAPKPGEGFVAAYRVARPGYFGVMGIALRRGRDFSAQDTPDSPGVIVLNEQLAQRLWPAEDPIGKRVTMGDPARNPRWLTIVGVVRNVKQRDWTAEPAHEIYVPFSQSPFLSDPALHHAAMTIVVRTAVEPSTLAAPLRHLVWSIDRNVPVSNVATLEQVIANTVWQPRFNLILIGLFAGLALLLAAIGLYGVMAYAVAQRTREFGVRLALGASHRDMLGLTLRQGLKLTAAGLGLGLAGALGLTRVLGTLLYEVKPNDPWTLAGVSCVLVVVGALACWLPARRAAKVDPMVALRCE